MEYLVTSNEMRAYDTYTIEQIGIPSLVLMERAALKTAEYIEMHFSNNSRVLCVCGIGNNGGDGLCVTRLLTEHGMKADAVLIGDENKASAETKTQLSILQNIGILPYKEIPDKEYDIIVDAIFGTGLKREVTGDYKEAINKINAKDCTKISIDIPSGIHTDNGKCMGTAVKADITITLAFFKRGLFLYPGSNYAGKIMKADIGISKKSFFEHKPYMYTFTDDAGKYFPKRIKEGNKGTFGKILLVAGSENMAGAAILAGKSAYKAGAGMVKLVIPEKIREIIQEVLPEALIQTYQNKQGISKEEKECFLANMEWADTIAIGPGLGISQISKELLKLILCHTQKPLVIDADGINILSREKDIMEALVKQAGEYHKPIILTPHMGELARLLQKDTVEIVQDETIATIEASERTHCIVVGKSARTHVCREGKPIFLNTAGSDKMATAGSGDILTGIIAAFLAQGMDPFHAAENGVYVHACAGDTMALKAGSAALKAGDIIEGLTYL